MKVSNFNASYNFHLVMFSSRMKPLQDLDSSKGPVVSLCWVTDNMVFEEEGIISFEYFILIYDLS